jgi:hypothetical protein
VSDAQVVSLMCFASYLVGLGLGRFIWKPRSREHTE